MYTYLALGDSYTIGESLPIYESFPYQTVQLLRKANIDCITEIVAKTGWTTDELQFAINGTKLLPRYDVVSLLIGVNNQYRNRSVIEYRDQFENLLRQAIQFAGNRSSHVFVLSIPDWGATPFAKDRDAKSITIEIDAFNVANKLTAEQYKVNYIDITPGTRLAAKDTSLLANDQLHYSAKEHANWAAQLTKNIISLCNN